MALIDILEAHFKKGAAVFPSSTRLAQVKGALFAALASAFPWHDKETNSHFSVFARVDLPHASNGHATITHAVRSAEAPAVGKKLWKAYDKAGGGPLPDLIQEFAQLMLSESSVTAFIQESTETRYALGIDYYPNRAPKASAGYHKDAYDNTTFILLAYNNAAPIWGAEWILDPGDPVNANANRPFEGVLPDEICTAIRRFRARVVGREIGSSNPLKDHEVWRQYARSKLIEPMGNVVFFDPIVTHSSPYQEHDHVLERFNSDDNGAYIRQDQPGFDNEVDFRFPNPGRALRKTSEEIARWNQHLSLLERSAQYRTGAGARPDAKLQRGREWLDAKKETFTKARAFIRIEVKAFKA